MIVLVKDVPRKGRVNRWPYLNFKDFAHFEDVAVVTMDILNKMCEDASNIREWQHKIISDYRPSDLGQHGKGLAIDMFFFHRKPGDVSVNEQFIFALRYDWRGVGFYPYNNIPSIHVDMRQDPKNVQRRALWWRDYKGNYHPGDNFRKLISVF